MQIAMLGMSLVNLYVPFPLRWGANAAWTSLAKCLGMMLGMDGTPPGMMRMRSPSCSFHVYTQLFQALYKL